MHYTEDKHTNILSKSDKNNMGLKENEKQRMVRRVGLNLEECPEKGRIMQAMYIIDRAYFVNNAMLKNDIYSDVPQPIGEGQTISQPSTVAKMLAMLNISPGHDLLEAGTGSGWNANLLAFLCYPGRIVTYEPLKNLARFAKNNSKEIRENLESKGMRYAARLKNIRFMTGNIWDAKGKYDRIIFTAGVYGLDDNNNTSDNFRGRQAPKGYESRHLSRFAKKHLKEDGRMLCPRRIGPMIFLLKKQGEITVQETEDQYSFVPLQY